jgi:hypothetical protein
MLMSNVSSRQLQANRLNALNSTGPTSPQGKARVSRNAIKHGMFASQLVLSGESQEDFDEFSRGLLLRMNPRDVLELNLAQQVISAQWRIRRLHAAEVEMYELQGQNLRQRIKQQAKSESSQRWQQLCSLESDAKYLAQSIKQRQRRQLPPKQQWLDEQQKVQQQIQTLQAMNRAAEIEPAPTAPQVLADMISGDDPAIERLQRYEQRLQNMVHRCLNELRKLRKDQPFDPQDPCEFTKALVGEEQNESPGRCLGSHGQAVGFSGEASESCETKPIRAQVAMTADDTSSAEDARETESAHNDAEELCHAVG